MEHKLEYDLCDYRKDLVARFPHYGLSEKGYKVLVIEKGKWFNENQKIFLKTNWNLQMDGCRN